MEKINIDFIINYSFSGKLLKSKNNDCIFKYNENIITCISEDGFFHILEWFDKSDFSVCTFRHVFYETILYNNNIIKVKFDKNLYVFKDKINDYNVLKWFNDSNYKFNKKKSYDARVNILEWLKKDGYKLKYNKFIIKKMCKNNYVLKWFKNNNYKTKNKYIKHYKH
jgi:hypothetical protein